LFCFSAFVSNFGRFCLASLPESNSRAIFVLTTHVKLLTGSLRLLQAKWPCKHKSVTLFVPGPLILSAAFVKDNPSSLWKL